MSKRESRAASSEGAGVVDALRRYVEALGGVTEVPRERAERIVTDLAKRGEIRARDIQRSARRLAERSARNREELVGLVRKEIRRQIKVLGLATREDLDRLSKRVLQLERAAPSKGKPSARAKPSARGKASAARKPSVRKSRGSAKGSPSTKTER